MPVEIRVPPLGEGVVQATVGRWMKQEGKSVTRDEMLVELETDKVTVEVAAQQAGMLGPIARKEGDTARVNELLGSIIPDASEAGAADAEPRRLIEAGSAGASSDAARPNQTRVPVEIRFPHLGENLLEATVGRWRKKEGESVAKGEIVVELETDKVTVEVPAERAGTLGPIAKQEGEAARVNEVLCSILSDPAEAGVADAEPPGLFERLIRKVLTVILPG